jgi:nucleoside-diphosphate-sugar epimerase
MSRVFVTGVNGFAGQYVAKALADAGHEVHGLVKPQHLTDISNVSRLYEADLNDINALKRVIAEVQPNSVIHLAAIAFVAHGNAEDIYRTNVLGTRSLLEALSSQKIEYDAVMLMSSANVYGNKVPGQLDENVPPNPVNDYALSKLTMEYLTHIYSDIPFIIVRPFNYTGIGQDKNFIIPKIIDHAKKKSQFLELGNIDVARDFSDVRFVADCCQRLLDTPSAIGQTFNICSGTPHRLSDIIHEIEQMSEHHFEIVQNPAFIRQNEVSQLWGDPSKLRALLNGINNLPFSDTLRWMLEA